MQNIPYHLHFFPDPVLSKVCSSVDEVTESLVDLAGRMLELMHQHEGIGLAAPQVGILQRLFVMNVNDDPLTLINPEIIQVSGVMVEMEEGCLSLPGVYVPVQRPESLDIAYTDLEGTRRHKRLVGLQARCAQHELDHLDGRLHIAYWAPHLRYAKLRAYIKAMKNRPRSPQAS